MKKYLYKTILFCASFVALNVVNAQKIGHLNFQDIILLMPEYEKASKEYEIYQASLEDDLKEIENRGAVLGQKMEAEQKKPQPSTTKMKIYQQQMQELQQEYQEKQQTIQDSMKSKLADLVAPIKKKIEAAVAEIAKEQGYSHVIDNSYGTLIYADEAYNLEKAVKERLKIKEKPKTPAASTVPQRNAPRR